ncbi:MAG: hypothetical protein K9M36_03490 [Candidatus Pacebacteria bacterium]|nr:hypothetical protein [Candidatus Paceibacterota bacterium]
MNEIMKSDIFFFVTTIAVVLVTIGLLVVFVMIIQTLRDVRKTVHTFEKRGMDMLDYVVQIPREVFGGVLNLFGSFIKKSNKKK